MYEREKLVFGQMKGTIGFIRENAFYYCNTQLEAKNIKKKGTMMCR